MSTAAEMLAEVPFFSLLDDQERTLLADRVELEKFEAGKTIFSFGDPGDALYVLRSGEIEVFVKNKTGEKIVLETATAGDFIGEISLLDGGARTASAVATKETEVLVVDRGDLEEFLKLRPAAAMDILSAIGKRLRQTSLLLRHSATRNANEVDVDNRSTVMKIADWISDFSGSLPFLFIHCGLFFVWIVWNIDSTKGLLPWWGFDPMPFGLLTMSVSLEAIILSVFVLLSQNRQAARDRVRSDVEYDVNLKAEMQIAHMHEKVDHMNAEILARLAKIEASVGGPKSVRPPVPPS